MSEARLVAEAASALAKRGVGEPELALVLGSGLRRLAERVANPVEVPFAEVPHWPAPLVAGHGASLVVGRVGQARVACLSGRVHLYEGWSPAEVVRAVRTLRWLGVPRFVITNAAGGIDPSLAPGDVMVIRDHLNLTGCSPLRGEIEPELGPRFPDQSCVYASDLVMRLAAVDPELAEGVYAGVQGPAYETPAEVRMLDAMGADAVGMSTVLEAMALSAMGAEVAGLSLISNRAAGLSDTPLSHEEVIAAGRQAEGRLLALLEGFCAGPWT
jgi:purine-nucleoside phosphorylase